MIQDTSMRCIFSNTDQAKPHVEDGRSLPDVADGEFRLSLKFSAWKVPPENHHAEARFLLDVLFKAIWILENERIRI